jgi:hypothetical protein
MNNYYTYAYLREDGTPYYIGKGKGYRAYNKGKEEIRPPRDRDRIILLKQNLTEEEAFKHEIYMIAVFGRKDLGTGILRNKSNGGDGNSGKIVSQKTRKQLSDLNKGKVIPKEVREKISKTLKGRKFSPETLEKIRNSTQSEEYRKKASERVRKRYENPEERIKTGNAMRGRVVSEETKQKLKEAALLRWERYRKQKVIE